jgi:hypothetical protein
MTNLLFEYDRSYDPSMPVATVTIRKIQSPHQRTLTAIIDSGADVTMIPRKELQALQIPQSTWAQLRGVAGISYRVPVYTVGLAIGSVAVGAVRVVGDTQNQPMILGRDVLNLLVLTLNGLAGMVEISD